MSPIPAPRQIAIITRTQTTDTMWIILLTAPVSSRKSCPRFSALAQSHGSSSKYCGWLSLLGRLELAGISGHEIERCRTAGGNHRHRTQLPKYLTTGSVSHRHEVGVVEIPGRVTSVDPGQETNSTREIQ